MRPLLITGFGTALRVNGHVLEVSKRGDGGRETFPAHQPPFDSVVVEGNSGPTSDCCLRGVHQQKVIVAVRAPLTCLPSQTGAGASAFLRDLDFAVLAHANRGRQPPT